jgi:diaminohydroxyphosphoribosylaminopyrimidine deaminase/5-amino-6-(5-phosphoribosylamino)uracil reductase
MTTPSADELFMNRALELARNGIGLASPNPCVGAVVVDPAGKLIGEGTHKYEHWKHAEVLALEQAGARARGATLFLNLEPCSHTGRTGPCVEAVIKAGIRRVVAAMSDPNPLVCGKGFERLRAAGIEVNVGIGEQEARKLNEAFSCWIRTRRPLVTLKTAMTLDGKIALPPESANPTALGAAAANRGYITSEAARAHVQELRHAADAILVGLGTVIADDPLLTDRTGRPRRRPLLRVILDSQLRIPPGSRLVQTAQNDLVVFCTACQPQRRKALEACGVRVEQVAKSSKTGSVDLAHVVNQLGAEQITSLIIEGGSLVNCSALRAGVVDKIFFYYAPRILGAGAVPFSAGTGFDQLAEAPQVKNIALYRFGEDFAVEGYLRDPYR